MNIQFASGNPYQRLLYSAPGMGYRLVPGRIRDIRGIVQALRSGGPRLLHLHWDDRFFGRGADRETTMREDLAVIQQFEQFRLSGGRILWTVHNDRPHHERDPFAFREARRMLSKNVDLVHVHAPHARDHVSREYDVPSDRIRIIPHPSYLGAYEPTATTLRREMPRSERRQFLFFGMMRRAKGTDELLSAAARLSRREEPFHLALHGKGFRKMRRVASRLENPSTISVSLTRVPDEEVATVFARAHIFVAPYSRMFTSGTIMLAQTFGLPVIGPDIPQMRQSVPPVCHRLLYPADERRGLIRKMREVIHMDDAEIETLRAACFDFACARAPHNVSMELGAALAELADVERWTVGTS